VNGNLTKLLTPKKKPTVPVPDPLPSFDPLSTDNIQRAYDDHQQNLDLNKKPSCCNRDVFAYCTTKSHCSCLRAGVDCRDCCSYNGCCLNRENPIPATTTTTTTKNVPRTKKPGKPKSCTHDKARGGFLFRPTTPATVAAEVGKIREAQSLVAADLSKQIETKIPSTSSDDDGIIGIIRKNIEIENSATNNNNNWRRRSIRTIVSFGTLSVRYLLYTIFVLSISFAIRSASATFLASNIDISSCVVYRFSSKVALTLNSFLLALN